MSAIQATRRLAIAGAFVGSLALASWARSAPPSEAVAGQDRAPHGATPMSEQLEQLGQLALTREVAVPPGISPAYWRELVPPDNPGSAAQVALGRALYFEPRLSRDGTVACATCHDIERGFGDRLETSEGIDDQHGRRNAPTTMNVAWFAAQFWDGRAATLEEQAELPILNPIEMGMPDGETAVAAIADDPKYQAAFEAAYGRAPNFADLTRAIASFERTLVFLDAPFDRFMAGDADAISAEAKAGWLLFHGKARCNACHQISSSDPIGTDRRFHNVGVSARHQDFEALAAKALEAIAKDSSAAALDSLALDSDLSELGRFVVTRLRPDIGAFKTPQVRNVGVTAPYMHDGSMATLWDVMDHYNRGGEANTFLDGGIEPLDLSEAEIEQLVVFMFSLTDDRFAAQNQAELDRQRALAATQRPFREPALAHREVLPFEARLQGRYP